VVWTVARRDGVLEIEPGDPAAPDAGIRTDPTTLNALLLDPGGLDRALATGPPRPRATSMPCAGG
jgi:hypothetical protein